MSKHIQHLINFISTLFPECPSGNFGMGCTTSCGAGCSGVCDHVTGACTCRTGWTNGGGVPCSGEIVVVVVVVVVVAAAAAAAAFGVDQQIFIMSHGVTLNYAIMLLMLSAFCDRGEDRTQYLAACEFNALPT
jgi:hypothetical protein